MQLVASRKVLALAIAFVLTITFVLVDTVSAQDARRVDRVREIEFKTVDRQGGTIEVSTGLVRSKYRLFENKEYRSPTQFLRAEGAAFGWKEPERDLVLISDLQSGSSRHVTYQQTFKGLPVLDHRVRVNMDAEGRVSMVLSAFSPMAADEGTFNATPLITGPDAAERAFSQYADGSGLHSQAKLGIIRPDSPVLVWEVLVWPENEPAEFRVHVDARTGIVIRAINQAISLGDKGVHHPKNSGYNSIVSADWNSVTPWWGKSADTILRDKMEFPTGSYLGVEKSVVSRADGLGTVYDPSPLHVANVVYGGAYVDGDNTTTSALDAARKTVTLAGITLNSANKYVLKGPNVSITGLNQSGTEVYTPPAESLLDGFQYTRAHSGFEAVNVYFHVDKSQRYVQSLGIIGRLAGPFLVNPQGLTRDDSFFFPSSNMILFGTGGVDDAEDPTVVWHEYAHALLEAASPGILSTQEGSAFHEGWADYWAASYLRSQVESGDAKRTDWRKLFAWDSGDGALWDGRTLDHSGIYPQSLCVTTGGSCSVHNDGRMWATTMMEVYDRLGRATTDRLSLLSHGYLVAPVKFSDAAEAVLQADLDYNGGANITTLISIFSARGLVSASNYAPIVVHSALADTEMLGGTIVVEARATGISAQIANFKLFVETGSGGSQIISMAEASSNLYRGSLTLPAQVDNVFYYLRAEDLDGRVTVLPEGAPGIRFRFAVGQDFHAPVIVHTPLSSSALVDWPLSIQAQVTDNFSIKSVVAEYSLLNPDGTTSLSGEMALGASGSTYSAQLSVPFEHLFRGSTLRYALVAVDNSLAKNTGRYPATGFIEVAVSAVGELRRLSFEATEKSQWTSSGLWQNGSPTFGRSRAFQASEVVSTGLQGAYPAEAGMSSLELPPINLKLIGVSKLSFWHFYDTENDGTVTPSSVAGLIQDGGFVQIKSNDISEWTTLVPKGGYPGRIGNDPSNPFRGQDAFGGFSYGWRRAEFDLPASDRVRIRFVFATNASNSEYSEAYAGWMLDQLSINTMALVDNSPPVVIEGPASQIVVSVDETQPSIQLRAEDLVGVQDVLLNWLFVSKTGKMSGKTRFFQHPDDPTIFSAALTMTSGAQAGDELIYSIELLDPSGNSTRIPASGEDHKVVFRIRGSSNALISVATSGSWQKIGSVTSISGSSEAGLSSLNLSLISIPENSTAAKLVLDHSFQFDTHMAGRVELSSNGGKNWQGIAPEGDYPGTYTGVGVPSMNGEKAFVGTSNGQLSSVFDLQNWSGQQVLLRVTAGVGSDSNFSSNWTIREIRVVFESDEDAFDVNPKFEILPIFPNPFQDRATVPFILSDPEDVEIGLYDLMGRAVSFIQSGTLGSGSHQVVIERGHLVPGVYFLRIRAGRDIRVRKVVIVN